MSSLCYQTSWPSLRVFGRNPRRHFYLANVRPHPTGADAAACRENALGWNDAGKRGTKAECLAYIEEVWTDMRPLSLRKKMEEGQS